MICKTFKELSKKTCFKIDQSRLVNFQQKEETFTDNNLLNLKVNHPNEIHIRVFSKLEESKNGSDWEWWLTDGYFWAGFRVQAKVINIEHDRFEHLHYQGKDSISQSEKLIFQASVPGEIPRIPIYCLYMSSDKLDDKVLLEDKKLYGCSLLSAHVVAKLRSSNINDINSLQDYLIPWHLLVCKNPKKNLGEHLNHFFSEYLNQDYTLGLPYLTDNPPAYVRQVLRNIEKTEDSYNRNGLAGVVIMNLIKGDEII